MESSPSSDPLDLDAIRSRVKELEEIHSNCKDDDDSVMSSQDSQELLQDCALQLQSKVKQIMTDCSDFSFLGIEDLDVFVDHLKEELTTAEANSAKISNEIDILTRTHNEDSSEFENELEVMKGLLDNITSQEKKEEEKGSDCASLSREDESNLTCLHGDEEYEVLKLKNQIDERNSILKSLQDFEYAFTRFDALEQIEEALSGLKVIEFDGTCIRLSLRTYVPKLEGLLCQQNIGDTTEPSEINHELLIEVIKGTMEIKSVEIFPNDVYVGDIIDAAKSFRELFSQLALVETRSSLEWFVRKVQDRIIQCTLRRAVVKNANSSRYSLEYVDRHETVVAHLVGVDALIKVSPGWPISSSPLKLTSMNTADHYLEEIPLSLLCKVEEVANSLGEDLRENLSSFVDAIEVILKEQMQLHIHPAGTSKQ
uniref:Uncharacterized protein n=3 Tax=Rhizophora mucronata TaxID=61149 RepID=A0A2P2JJN6_RHIMU